jgi:hypothetical protein
MPRRYLFGPVTASFADQHLRQARQAGDCLTFGSGAGVDLQTSAGDSWEAMTARFPAGWQPDFVALYLPCATIPAAPLPLVGLAADWQLHWHAYRNLLGKCDLILRDAAGAGVFERQGFEQARAANLCGLEHGFLEYSWPDEPRDIDVLVVGNPALHGEHVPWLARLAWLGKRWCVTIHTGAFGDHYKKLLGRARIVFKGGSPGHRRIFRPPAKVGEGLRPVRKLEEVGDIA